MTEIMTLRNVSVHFPVRGFLPFLKKGEIQAVSDVSLGVRRGEIFGLVGESGCGKTTLANTMVGLVKPTACLLYTSQCTEAEMQEIRGKELAMIFQDAMTSLNPVMTVGNQIDEMYRRHYGDSKQAAREKTVHALEPVSYTHLDVYKRQPKVLDLIKERLPWTLVLSVSTMLIGLIVGVLFGVVAAVKRGRWQDTLQMCIRDRCCTAAKTTT